MLILDYERCPAVTGIEYGSRTALGIKHEQRHDCRFGVGSLARYRFEPSDREAWVEPKAKLTLVTANPHPHSHSHGHSHSHDEPNGDASTIVSADDLERLKVFLTAHFGQVAPSSDEDDGLLALDITIDNLKARLDLISMVRLGKVCADNSAWRARMSS